MPDLYWANGRNAQGTLVMTKQVEKEGPVIIEVYGHRPYLLLAVECGL